MKYYARYVRPKAKGERNTRHANKLAAFFYLSVAGVRKPIDTR
jgi:hypothetical protein